MLTILLLAALLLLDSAHADLTVHFLDVGQGDSALVICDGEAMLIDGGPPSASQLIYTYLRQNVDALDVIIATHPHEDHIGGLAAALNAVPVGVIYSPVTQISLANNSQGTPIIVPNEGDEFDLGGAVVTILHCWPEAWTENDMSIVLRIDYGETSLLFTGDAEALSEYMMLDSGMPLHADVLKVGHHGSRSSSTDEFISAVSPTWAVISCGKDNSYSHPHEETLAALRNATVLRTDQMGTIVIRSDGTAFSLSSAIEIETAYIGNKKSKKFHYPDCESVADMAEKNKIPLASREDAIALGYEPCGRCQP